MKNILLIIAITVFLVQDIFACDMCGCYMGITPYDNQSSFGIYHRYRSFNGYGNADQTARFFPKNLLTPYDNSLPSAYPVQKHSGHDLPGDYSDKDYEIFSITEARAKFFIHNRIEINGILPYVTNSVRENDTVTHLNSIGDINLYAGFHLIRPDVTKNVMHRLILGAGIKLATGHYYIGYYEGNRTSLLNQPGSGSNDLMTYINYVFGFKKWGFSTNFSYKINGSNYFNEKIGNSLTNFSNVFYKMKKGDFIFIPSIQTYFETSPGLFVDEIYQSSTSVSAFLLGPGFDLFYKNFGLNTNFQITAFEDYHDGNLRSGCKLLLGLTYNFNQKKYLLDKKAKE